ncbi:MAG TPA: PDZ domain-containing protein [Pyrinomonadaceae bacterium]|nr:PDZ domain-containing protein [Pyrinomonadaceae bacterium]
MQTKHEEAERQFEGAGVVTCPNCRAEMVAGLRFCRMCGFRLGEGVEEYTETRRFDGKTPPFAPPAAAAKEAPNFAANHTWAAAPLANVAPHAPARAGDAAGKCAGRFGSWRMGWIGWVVLALVLMFAVGTVMRSARRANRVNEAPRISVEREVDGFETADGGGAFIKGLDGPGTTLEAAGLRGGDVITAFDGKPVRDARSLRRILRDTPPGKTVEIVYVSEGQTRTATIVTAAAGGYRGREALRARPGGEGQIGVNVGGRVRVAELNTHGTELDRVTRNGPADMAGLKRGDVVLEFNGQPTRTPGDLRLRIYEAVPNSTVTAVVMRDGQRMEIPVKVGRSRDDD